MPTGGSLARKTCVLATVAALCALPLLCITAPVSISGRVVDENGVALEGVRLDLSGGSLTTSISALSGAAGDFSLSLEQAGDYRIRAERRGFFVFVQNSVSFHEGVNQLAVTLNHLTEFAESVDVVYSPAGIDLKAPAAVSQLSNVAIMQIPYPASQDFRSALPMLQGVVQDVSGRPHFNGGGTAQASYRLNGFNIADPVTGRLETRLNIESVETLELQSSRFSPEIGRGSSGALDIKTEMGDDRWRYSGTNFIPGIGSQDGFHINKWTPRFKVSGPLWKGRAWFHNGFDAFYDLNTVSGLPHGENRNRSFIGSNLTRVQVNFKPSNLFTASFLINRGQDRRQGLSFLDPVETTLNRRNSLQLATVKDQIYFRGGGVLEFGMSDMRVYFHSSPQGNQVFRISPTGRSGNYFVDLARHSSRQQWTGQGVLPKFQFAGSHQISAGTDFERSGVHRTSERHDYQILRADLSLARQVSFAGNPSESRSVLEASQYILDRWSPLDALLIEGGMRSDWHQVLGHAVLSPRLSAVYAPAFLHDTKLAVGYGIFYDALTLETLGVRHDQVSYSTFFSSNGSALGPPVETGFLLNEHQLRLPRYRTSSFSVERKLPFEIFGRVNLTHRIGTHGFTFVGDSLVEPFLPFSRANFYSLSNARRDEYNAAEFTIRRTFAKQYEWSAGYTRSSARSNSVIDYNLENPIFAAQSRGPFPWDAPHRFVTWGWAPIQSRWFPKFLRPVIGETAIAFLAEYRTGFPFSIVNEEGVLIGAPNHMRLPSYFDINFDLERRFRLLHYLWEWRVGLNNATNNGNPNVVNNNIDSRSFLSYGRGQPRAVAVRLHFIGKK